MLSHSHIRLLKKIKRNKIVKTHKKHKDLDYLYDNKYIGLTVCDKPDDYFAQPYLTEKGKARLYEEQCKIIEIWLPVAISALLSIAALVISIIALTK